MQSTEIWKPVVGYEGMYEVSTRGNIRGLDRVIYDSSRKVYRRWSGRVIKATPNVKSGHLSVALCRDGKPSRVYVHRLVLEAHVGFAAEGQEGCHSDGNPANNCVENLRWDTRLENVRDSMRHGTHLGGRRKR